MNWLNNFVRPKIRALVRSDVPENLWHKCPGCEAMLFHRDLAAALHVCPHCGYHMRISPETRLAMLFDDGAYTAIELPKPPHDPLKFRDSKRYADRLREAQSRTGRNDAVVVAHGTLGGQNVVIAAFDFAFLGGSMGTAVGDAVLAAAQLALLQASPLIVVPSSGGARMQEGPLSLMQMARTTIAVQQVREAGLPYIVVLADPTTGGVTASFAMLGDIHVAEPGAQIGFAGSRVIEETIRETLPDGFQRAEYLRDHGMIDLVVPRAQMAETLRRLVALFMVPDRPPDTIALPAPEAAEANAAAGPDGGDGQAAVAPTTSGEALAHDPGADAGR